MMGTIKKKSWNSWTYELDFVDEFLGDELLSDSFPYKEIENGLLWEVEGKVRNKNFYNNFKPLFLFFFHALFFNHKLA
jgi:hypothetical protein